MMLRIMALIACVASAAAFAPALRSLPQIAPGRSASSAMGLQMNGNPNRTKLVSTPKWRRIAGKKAAKQEAGKHLLAEDFATYMAKQGFARKAAEELYKHGKK
mmetsp:Transcript_48356/g.77916  ORF Transcript_48356/g.77916 Transcript_48356/m.77916 type:complete len:103 (-) Transcript_48356:260-568(-)